VTLKVQPQQWAGPLSRELLVFNSFVKALSKSLRHLLEAVGVHSLLSGDARRNRDDFADIMLSKSLRPAAADDDQGLPFQFEPNTGFGILAKTYLDAATFHYGDSITMENVESEGVKKAKQDALAFVAQNFTSVKGPLVEVDRGFRFWDAVSRCGSWPDENRP
jgi:hypothetical protein